MLKSFRSLPLAFALAACGHTTVSKVAAHSHRADRSTVSDAAAIAGEYTEDKAQRQEWNQAAPFTGTLSLVQAAGTAGGTYVNIDENGKQTAGDWVVESNGALTFDHGYSSFGYELTATSLTVIGDHDESRTVFIRD